MVSAVAEPLLMEFEPPAVRPETAFAVAGDVPAALEVGQVIEAFPGPDLCSKYRKAWHNILPVSAGVPRPFLLWFFPLPAPWPFSF